MSQATELLSAQQVEQQEAWAAVNVALGRLSLAYGIDPDSLNEPAGAALETIVTELHDRLPVVEPIPLPVQRQTEPPPRPKPKPYDPRFLGDKPWGQGHLRMAERTAIRMAINVLGEGPHSANTWNAAAGSKDELCNAARNLGAMGATRAELLVDLAGILTLYVPLTGSVQQALRLAEDDL